MLFIVLMFDFAGACLINMLVNYLGKDNFFKGITQYLNNFSYGNSVNMDLILALAKQAPENKKHIVVKRKLFNHHNFIIYPYIFFEF